MQCGGTATTHPYEAVCKSPEITGIENTDMLFPAKSPASQS